MIGVSNGPGLMAFTRMPRPISSAVQVRTSERTAALVALWDTVAGNALVGRDRRDQDD